MRPALFQLGLFFSLAFAVVRLGAAETSALPLAVQSRTGQFTVHGEPSNSPNPLSRDALRRPGIARLEPNLTAVSAERVKAALWRQLGVTGAWLGKVRVVIVPVIARDQNVNLASTLYRSGWQYRLEVPREMPEQQFIRALVQVILLELANRNSSGRSAEVPLWLTEGWTQYLIATEPDLVMHLEERILRNERRADPLQRARASLGGHSPLTFNELSWPGSDDLSGERWEVFQRSAHFFLTAVLRQPGGPASLRKFLQELPQYLNWQTAFLRGFAPRFERLIDVEKWWAVTLSRFTDRNEWQLWSAETALEKIDATLLVEAEVRTHPKAVPVPANMKIEAVLREWDWQHQEPTLRGMINTLAALRLSVPGELVQLLDDYRACLEDYLTRRRGAGFSATKGQSVTRADTIVRETLQRLHSLDQRREMWRHEYTAAAGSALPPKP